MHFEHEQAQQQYLSQLAQASQDNQGDAETQLLEFKEMSKRLQEDLIEYYRQMDNRGFVTSLHKKILK